MADLKTYGEFKDWAFGLLLLGNIGMQLTINNTVNKLDKNDAVNTALYRELDKNHTELKAEFSLLKNEQQETAKDIARIQEFLRPTETRSQRKLGNR